MRLVLQRVGSASVRVGDERIAAIGLGTLALVGIERDDDEDDARKAATKVAALRMFEDEAGKMNLALADVGGAALAISQFTLAGSIDKGRRPGFDRAMAPDAARVLFERFVLHLRGEGVVVQTGTFGADMKVELMNDGPVTFIYETRRLRGR